MSRGRTTESTENPISKYIFWGERNKKWAFLNSDNEIESIDDPLCFMILESDTFVVSGKKKGGRKVKSTIGSRSGRYNNLSSVNHRREIPLKVFYADDSSDIIAEGTYWNSVSEVVKEKGGRYTANLLVMLPLGGGEYEIGCIRMHGLTLSSWFMSSDGVKLDGNFLFTTNVETEVKSNEYIESYHVPVFTHKAISNATAIESADRLAKEVQDWLESYWFGNKDLELQKNDVTKTNHPESSQYKLHQEMIHDSSRVDSIQVIYDNWADIVEKMEDENLSVTQRGDVMNAYQLKADNLCDSLGNSRVLLELNGEISDPVPSVSDLGKDAKEARTEKNTDLEAGDDLPF